MSLIFSFRMLSDEDDNFVRDYEVPTSINLKEFHDFICQDIDYDSQEMSSFFASDKSWQKIKEFTLVDMGITQADVTAQDDLSPVAMDKVLLKEVTKSLGDRLLFVFDLFEDRVMFIELTDIKKPTDGMTYPRVMFANGEAPDQYDAANSSNNKSIFDEAMDDWGGFEGDDEYEDEY